MPPSSAPLSYSYTRPTVLLPLVLIAALLVAQAVRPPSSLATTPTNLVAWGWSPGHDKANIDTSSAGQLVAVSASDTYAVGLTSTGGATFTGDEPNADGQPRVATPVRNWTKLTQVAAARTYALGLTAAGTVNFAGLDPDPTTGPQSPGPIATAVSTWTGITQLAAADDFAVGLSATGTVSVAGRYAPPNTSSAHLRAAAACIDGDAPRGYGDWLAGVTTSGGVAVYDRVPPSSIINSQTGLPYPANPAHTVPAALATATDVIAVTCGDTFGVALHLDGSLTAWGNLGALGNPNLATITNAVQISAHTHDSAGHSFLVVLTRDGKVSTIGTASDAVNNTPSLTHAAFVASNAFGGLALTGTLPAIAASWTFNGEVTVPFGATLTSSLLTVVSSGALPPGLTLHADGQFTGVPTSAGDYSALIGVSTAVGAVPIYGRLHVVIIPPPATVSTAPVFDALPGRDKSVQWTLPASGGTGSGYTFSLASGSLPTGFVLLPNGMIAGTVTQAAAGIRTFTVRVTDSAGGYGTAPQTINIRKVVDLFVGTAVQLSSTQLGVSLANGAPAVGTLPQGVAVASNSLVGTPVTSQTTVDTFAGPSFSTDVVFRVGVVRTSWVCGCATSTFRLPWASTTSTTSRSLVSFGSSPAGVTLKADGTVQGQGDVPGSVGDVEVTTTGGSGTIVRPLRIIVPNADLRIDDKDAASARCWDGMQLYAGDQSGSNDCGFVNRFALRPLVPQLPAGVHVSSVELLNGSLPPGVTLGQDGVMHGTATSTGSTSAVLRFVLPDGTAFVESVSFTTY